MEFKRVHYILLITTFVLINDPTCTHSADAFHKKIEHQQQINLDYFAKPVLTGEEYEVAKNVAAAKIKRQQPQDDSNEDLKSTFPTAATSEEVSPTLSPLVNTTGLDELENTTELTGSPSPPSQSPSPSPIPTSTELVSSSTTTEATTPSSTTTTTEEPSPYSLWEGLRTKDYFCLCDYKVKVCDMNCCCDPDCSTIEKLAFKRCEVNSMLYDPFTQSTKEHSCFKSYIMYRQNAPFRVDRTNKNLFCVVRENAAQEHEFNQADMARISTMISHGKLDTRPKYTWDSVHEETKTTSLNYDVYKYGSAIWTVKSEYENGEEVNRREVMLRLPAPFHTDLCSILEPVKYLQESETQCGRPLYDVSSQCKTLGVLNANHFIRDLSVISNPARLDDNSTEGVFKQITPLVWCYNTWNDCTPLKITPNGRESEFPQPELEGFITANKCSNVLSQLNLTFVHEGINGISKIFAKALLVDVPFGEGRIVQQFKTEFIWSKSAKNASDTKNTTNANSPGGFMEELLHLRKLPRSGNPGYIVGKPLILGEKVTRKVLSTNESDGKPRFVEKMFITPEASQWLHIQSAGNCPLTHEEIRDRPKYPILFGYDHMSSCSLPLEHFRYCEDLQKHIASVVFGLTGEISPKQFTMLPFYVAAYGSPDAFPGDWVRLKFVEISSLIEGFSQFPSSPLSPGSNSIANGCSRMTTALHITVAYAYVGPVDSPQAKITGVYYEPEEPISIPDSSNKNHIRHIPVITTVTFLDVTGKPTTRVATFPVVSVQLPGDFFYPFSSSSRPSSGANKRAPENNLSSLSLSLAFFILFLGTLML